MVLEECCLLADPLRIHTVLEDFPNYCYVKEDFSSSAFLFRFDARDGHRVEEVMLYLGQIFVLVLIPFFKKNVEISQLNYINL